MQEQIILNRLWQGTWFSTVECVRDFHNVRHLSGNALTGHLTLRSELNVVDGFGLTSDAQFFFH
jgi:hypothetical protein